MFRWLFGRGASPRRIEREAARIAPAVWQRTVANHFFLAGLSNVENDALRRRAAWLLASKTFNSTHGLVLDDNIMLSIAVQAALPILNLDPTLYEGWHEIIVYPGGFLIARKDVDDSGVVHEYMQEASGEAWDGGPVILSWEDANSNASFNGNVVIHEFAHKLDLHGGEADGIPAMHARPELSARHWRNVLSDAFERFSDALEAVENAIPSDVDPESTAADRWYAALPMDAYAATDPAEFFAVSSETFFVDPEPLANALPAWYDLLRTYYRQDPRARQRLGSHVC